MTIADYLIEFDRMNAQLSVHNIKLPEPVLAYRALKSANLTNDNEKLVKATVTELTLKAMSAQLKKVMGTGTVNEASGIQIKKEEVAFTEDIQSKQENEEVLYSGWSRGRSRVREFRGRTPFRGRRGRSGRPSYRTPGRGRWPRTSQTDKLNPIGPDGNISTCYNCKSKYHWANDCEIDDDNEEEALIVLLCEEDFVYTAQDEKEKITKTLLGETLGCMVLDSGTTSTVAGLTWFNCFTDTLSERMKKRMTISNGTKTFKFGSGQKLTSMKKVILPCVIGGIRMDIHSDIVNAEIPLLLSNKAMKKAKAILDFERDVIHIGTKSIKLSTTSTGHYYVSVSKPLPTDLEPCLVLFMKNIHEKSDKEKLKIATKLHLQFNHATGKRMSQLARNSGMTDNNFLKMLEELPSTCEICLRHKKTPPRPVVGFSLASRFNEWVAMDIKEIKGQKVLHLIDLGTKYSISVRIPNKESSTIIDAIFKHWIGYFGTPYNILTDNGREFDNQFFRDMCQNVNVIVRTTAAESPWSNGVCERYNAVIEEGVVKTQEDVKCSFDTALAWAVSAKNTLHTSHGYSPNQLVFGRNPNLPAVLNDKPPALEGVTASELVAENLNAMHAARKSYIANESSEKLRRAIRHQIRPSISEKYDNGDLVLFKRNNIDRWQGPGSVIGSEAKQILVKHGGSYVRVHPCRLMHYPGNTYHSSNSQLEDPSASNEDNEPENDPENENIMEEQIDPPPEIESLNETPDTEQVAKKVMKISDLPKLGQILNCRMADDSQLENVKVLSRAGKVTGRNKFYLNVTQDNKPMCLDFENAIKSWEVINDPETDENELVQESYLSAVEDPLVRNAKKKELVSWEINKVYTKVADIGQDRVDTRWVNSDRYEKGKKIVKARLVAKGFQDTDASTVRTDSPTCSKEGFRMALAVIATNGWTCHSMDIRTAFLQSREIDRPVYVTPPPEAECQKGYIWKLNKCVYGLNDASRNWYLTIKEQLLHLGAKESKYDQAIFIWHFNNKLHGIISTHVDDFCWGGSKAFRTSVIDKIKEKFTV